MKRRVLLNCSFVLTLVENLFLIIHSHNNLMLGVLTAEWRVVSPSKRTSRKGATRKWKGPYA